MDHTGQQISQLPVVTRQRQVGPDLGGGIAQPHRVDIAGDHEGVRLAFQVAGAHGGVERIRKAVLEKPGELRVGTRADLDLSDLGLHPRVARELAFGKSRPARCSRTPRNEAGTGGERRGGGLRVKRRREGIRSLSAFGCQLTADNAAHEEISRNPKLSHHRRLRVGRRSRKS